MTRYELRSWDSVYGHSLKLAEKIKSHGFVPDIVIGLARGGWVPARNMCDLLGIKNLLSLKVEHWGETATKDKQAKIKGGISADLAGKNVLLVDDVADTGESMHLALEHVKALGPREVRSATLHVFDSTPKDRRPDFYVEEMEWRWIVYPWNVTEDVIAIMNDLFDGKKAMKEGDVKHGLRDRFNIKLDDEIMDYIMEEAVRRKKFGKEGSSLIKVD